MKITIGKQSVALLQREGCLRYAGSSANTEGYGRVMLDLAQALGRKAVCTGEEASQAAALLVGETDAPESAAAMQLLAGKKNAFAIVATASCVALVGSDALMTLMAVQYFKENYLTAEELPTTTLVEDVETLLLADPEGSYATYVYGAQLYDKKHHPIPELVRVYERWDLRDMPCVLIDTLVNDLAARTGVAAEGFSVIKDDAPVTDTEVVIGISARPAARAILDTLNGGEYALRITEKGIVATGWNYASLELSYNLLSDLVKEATASAEEGKASISLPVGLSFTASANPGWITDFPKPEGEGIALYNTLDTNDDSLQYLYTGEGITPESYLAYCADLEKNGYVLHMQSECEESIFRTYVNKDAGVMLYAAYEAYAHQYEYAPRFQKDIRIVTSPLSKVAIPPKEIITPAPAYKKVTNTAVTAIEVTGRATGMGYIITLEDGSFIVFDGGGLNPEPKESDTIWKLLCLRHEQIYGALPTPENPIRVAAWIITHSHWDHYGAYRVFIDKYGKSELFSMKYMIGNFPSRSSVYGIINQDILNMGTPAVMQKLHDGMREDFTFLKVHAGQKYYFANLEMQVMMTYDNISPARIYNQNDTSTVLRFKLQATNEQGDAVGDPYIMMWLGDANNNESRYLCAMYGKYLRADSTSVAHHGNIGCETPLYNTINANTIWWPHIARGARHYIMPEKRTASWVYDVDQTLVYENPNTKYVYFSGSYSRIDEKTIEPWHMHITLPFGDDGRPAHDKAYDTVRGEAHLIAYTDGVVPGCVACRKK